MTDRLTVTIRPFDHSPADYETVTRLGNLCYPDHPETPAELVDADAKRNAKYLQARFIAENEHGEPVGFTYYSQDADPFHPRKFKIDVMVQPDYRRRGVGTRLYEHILSALGTYEPVSFGAYVPEPVKIRQATPRDYHAVASVYSAVFPEYPLTAEEIRFGDEKRNEKLRHDRFVIEEGGEIVAVGEYGQRMGAYHPHRFSLQIAATPAYQGRGFGKALYEHLLAALRPFAPQELSGDTLADRERAVRFLTERGFVVAQTEQVSALAPANFDPGAWRDAVAKVAAQGIVIKTFAELKNTDPDVYTKCEALHWELSQDVPHTETMTRPPMDEWMKRYDRPDFLPDANFFAVTPTGEYVGMTILWRSLANNDLNTGITGVMPAFRKRGIATSLKVRALMFAKEVGADFVWTSNEVNNTGMLGINARFGFERRPDELQFKKRIPSPNE